MPDQDQAQATTGAPDSDQLVQDQADGPLTGPEDDNADPGAGDEYGADGPLGVLIEPEPDAEPAEAPAERHDEPDAAEDVEDNAEPSAPAFDVDAWATTQGIDRDLVKGCTTPQEALGRLAQRVKDLDRLRGSLGNRLGEAERRLQELASAAGGRSAEPRPAPMPDTQEPGAMTEEQAAAVATMDEETAERYLAWQDRDPASAQRWLYANYLAADVRQTVQQAIAQERERMRLEAADAAAEAALDAFAKERPDLDERLPKMRELADEIGRQTGRMLSYEDLYDLAVAADGDPARYRDLHDRVLAGNQVSVAKELLDLRAAKASDVRAAPERAKAAAARVGPATGGAGGPQPVPDLRLRGRTVRDLPEEAFDALLGG